MQLGRLSGSGLAQHLQDSLANAAWGALPLVVAGFHALGNPSALVELDALAEALLTTAAANRASRAMGQAWIATAAATFPDRPVAQLKRQLRAAAGPGHLAPWFGAGCASLEFDVEATRRLFLFLHVRGQISTAVRLGAIGPLAAQCLQADLAGTVEHLLAITATATLDDLALVAPLHEILHGHHDRLHSRMFAT